MPILTKDANYPVVAADNGAIIKKTALVSATFTLPGAVAGYNVCIYNYAGTDVIIEFTAATETSSAAYANLLASFDRPAVAAFYLLAMVVLGAHLAHGLYTAVNDLGVTGARSRALLTGAGGLLALAVMVLLGERAPETIVNKPAADVYALGITLYRMLTGELPFRGARDHVTTAILTRAPTHPMQINRGLVRLPDLDALIMQMLEKDPSRRPGIKEVLTRLDQAVAPAVLFRRSTARLRVEAGKFHRMQACRGQL